MVTWSLPAKDDLKRIYDFISRDSKYYATKVTLDLVQKTEKLNDFPKIGRIVPEIDNPNVRELFAYSYRLIYRKSENGVEILAIIHGKQDFSSGDLDVVRQ
jgi:addiction module RelE/StbE family toxin